MEYPFAGVKSVIITAPVWKSGSLVWSQLCHDSHFALGLHFVSLGLSVFFSIKQEAWGHDIGSQPTGGFDKGLHKRKRCSEKCIHTLKCLGRGGSGRDTVLSDALMTHGNCWEEAASYSIRSCSNIKKATAAPEAVLALPSLSPARTPGNLR